MGLNEENKGRQQQIRLRLKFQKSVSIIKEEVSDEEIEEEDNSSEGSESVLGDQDQTMDVQETKDKQLGKSSQELAQPAGTTMIDTSAKKEVV